MGLSFTIAASPRQRSHSQVRVLWDSLPPFTVSNSSLSRPYLYPPRRGWPGYAPRHWVHFRRLLRLAGLRWIFSTPPPHEILTKQMWEITAVTNLTYYSSILLKGQWKTTKHSQLQIRFRTSYQPSQVHINAFLYAGNRIRIFIIALQTESYFPKIYLRIRQKMCYLRQNSIRERKWNTAIIC
jgi:hypothetical protein